MACYARNPPPARRVTVTVGPIPAETRAKLIEIGAANKSLKEAAKESGSDPEDVWVSTVKKCARFEFDPFFMLRRAEPKLELTKDESKEAARIFGSRKLQTLVPPTDMIWLYTSALEGALINTFEKIFSARNGEPTECYVYGAWLTGYDEALTKSDYHIELERCDFSYIIEEHL